MDDETRRRLQGTFDAAATPYASSRPSYPEPVVGWLLGAGSGRPAARRYDVLDLAAGSGALTRLLVPWARTLVAAEPSANLLRELCATTPVDLGVRATAERLPFPDSTFDTVTVATAFHWFDPEVALAEIARVLRPGGAVALVWNVRTKSTPVARALADLLRSARPPSLQGEWGAVSAEALDHSEWFEPPERAQFDHVQLADREAFVALVSSRSYVIALDEPERHDLLARAAAVVDDHADERGVVEIPYVASGWRSRRRDT